MFLSKIDKVFNLIGKYMKYRGCGGCNPWEGVGCCIL